MKPQVRGDGEADVLAGVHSRLRVRREKVRARRLEIPRSFRQLLLL